MSQSCDRLSEPWSTILSPVPVWLNIVDAAVPETLSRRILRLSLIGFALIAPSLCCGVLTSASYRHHWNPHSWSLFPTWFPVQIAALCICYFTLKGPWWIRGFFTFVSLALSIVLTIITIIVIAAANGDAA
jgi:hypothetical protein